MMRTQNNFFERFFAMKKYLAVLLAVVIVSTAFIACSKSSGKDETTTAKESTSVTVENPTDKAVIKDADAINFIKTSYTAKELGLDKVKEEYSFMISSTGVKIDGKQYVKVAANVMKKNDETAANGKTTFSLTPVGEFYISYDGKNVLKKDLDSGEYTKLENRYQDYKAKGETVSSTKKAKQ